VAGWCLLALLLVETGSVLGMIQNGTRNPTEIPIAALHVETLRGADGDMPRMSSVSRAISLDFGVWPRVSSQRMCSLLDQLEQLGLRYPRLSTAPGGDRSESRKVVPERAQTSHGLGGQAAEG
jgi:hypothetical protein